MGKITNKSGVEIIPINSNRENKPSSTVSPSQKMQRMPYISDPSIVPRVQKYLESNVDKTYVDINVMADYLRQTYKEYSKRKRSAFRASVKKAYSIVLQSYGLEEPASSDEEDVSDESEQEDESNFRENTMNNQLSQMYKRPKQIDENELIDISSDESDESPTNFSNNKTSNGPSTSQKESQASLSIFYNNIAQQLAQSGVSTFPGASMASDRGKKRKLDSSSLKNVTKKRKSPSGHYYIQEPVATFKNVGGMNKTLEEVCKLLMHIRHPEVYKEIGTTSPRGFLLHGPPGCGKTLLAKAIAGELSVPLIKVAAPELVAGVSGESEERIRELFERAANSAPCVLFIDEIDAITPNRQNAQKEMERRIVAQLISCLDDVCQYDIGDKVLVIGATNRPDTIDPALRRAGRFDKEISMGIPDIRARAEILKVLTKNLKLSEQFDFDSLAKYTPGYVGADLSLLTREAAMVAVNRKFTDLKEARKLEDAQKVNEKKKKPQTEDDDVQVVVPDSNKNVEAEIIVDDDVSSKEAAVESVNGASTSSDTPAVVIDEETSSTTTKKPEAESTSLNGKPDEDIIETVEDVIVPEAEQMPVDVNNSKSEDENNKTYLEELLSWLHDKRPFSPSQLESVCITMDDFAKALKCVQPSAKREGFATVPDTVWDDVGSLRDVREELQMAILAPVRHAEQFKALGMNVPTGVFLCGPPGCGKTLLAKAIANEAGINFISVKGPELLNMYVGESERAVRTCFERARNSAPCVIFFDELDALCPKRSDTREGGATMRVVNQMLTEMDGVEGRQGVFLLAASNRPDIIDPAVLRPGRLDKIIFVGLPTAADRVDILRAITKNGTLPQLAPDVDLEAIGKSEQCAGYTGADLAALVREASVVALKEVMIRGDADKSASIMLTTEHFTLAVSKIRPSVTEKDQKHYEKLRKLYAAVPEQSEVEEMEYS